MKGSEKRDVWLFCGCSMPSSEFIVRITQQRSPNKTFFLALSLLESSIYLDCETRVGEWSHSIYWEYKYYSVYDVSHFGNRLIPFGDLFLSISFESHTLHKIYSIADWFHRKRWRFMFLCWNFVLSLSISSSIFGFFWFPTNKEYCWNLLRDVILCKDILVNAHHVYIIARQ